MTEENPTPNNYIDHRYEQTGAELDHSTATAHIMEQAELYKATPLRSEPDPREVWLTTDQAQLDGNPSQEVRQAFDDLSEGMHLIANAICPHGYQTADEREGLLWSLVNAIDYRERDAQKKIAALTDETQILAREQDGTEATSLELENKTDRMIAESGKREIFERFRDHAASIYQDDTTKAWAPMKGSHVSQTSDIPARIDSREFLRARQNHQDLPDIPKGTVVAVTGSTKWSDHHAIYSRLDAVKAKYPDVVIVHGDAKGAQKIGARWAESRDRPHVPFEPDRPKHGTAAPKHRDDLIFQTNPIAVLSFTIPGERTPWLHEKAEKNMIPVWELRDTRNLTRDRPAELQTEQTRQPQPSAEALARREHNYTRTSIMPQGLAETGTYNTQPSTSADHWAPGDAAAYLAHSHSDVMDSASLAFRDLVDSVHSDHEDNYKQRESLFRNILHAVDREITAPGGLIDRQQDLSDRVVGLKHDGDQLDVARIDDQSEISIDRNSENSLQLENINHRLSVAEHVRARLSEDFEAETGAHWLPRASYSPKNSQATTAAAAEARKAIDTQQNNYDQARVPEGRPIAVTGLRESASRETIFAALDQEKAETPDMYLIHGNAQGTQRMAGEWARENGVKQVTFAPRHSDGAAKIPNRDRAIFNAGPIRVIDFSNAQKPTLLAKLARENNIPIRTVTDHYQHTSTPESHRQQAQKQLKDQQQSQEHAQQQEASMSM